MRLCVAVLRMFCPFSAGAAPRIQHVDLMLLWPSDRLVTGPPLMGSSPFATQLLFQQSSALICTFSAISLNIYINSNLNLKELEMKH